MSDRGDEQGADAAAISPRRMSVAHVRGRGSSPDKGLATAHSMAITDGNGGFMRIGRRDESTQPQIAVQPLLFAESRAFDRCPICLDFGPTSREHVPPEALGGSVMTRTCHRCNNELGSRLETHLVDWYEDAVTARFASDSVRGARRSPRVLIRETDGGEFVLLPDKGRLDPAIGDMLASGAVDFIYQPPDPRLYRLAALKSAYLAACLLLKKIPNTPRAQAIRAELMAARERPRAERPGLSNLSTSLLLGRSHGPAAPGEIMLAWTRPSDGTNGELAISLARTLLVTWPLEPPRVRTRSQLDHDADPSAPEGRQ